MAEKKISFSLRRYPNSNATPQQQVSHTCISAPTLPGSNKWPFQPQANEEKRTRLEALGRPSVHPWHIENQQLECQIVIILHIYIYLNVKRFMHNAKHFDVFYVYLSNLPPCQKHLLSLSFQNILNTSYTVNDWKHLFYHSALPSHFSDFLGVPLPSLDRCWPRIHQVVTKLFTSLDCMLRGRMWEPFHLDPGILEGDLTWKSAAVCSFFSKLPPAWFIGCLPRRWGIPTLHRKSCFSAMLPHVKVFGFWSFSPIEK